MIYVEYFALFISTLGMVFLLGLQSRNVQKSDYLAAIVTSFLISVFNFVFVKYASSGGIWALASSALGGCIGIAGSIWFSDKVLHKKTELKSFSELSAQEVEDVLNDSRR